MSTNNMIGNAVCWNITNICNRNCQYCFRELNENAQSLETNLGILNNLKEIGIKKITFSGGEPFIYPYIINLMAKAKEYGMTVNVVTNGSLLKEDNVEYYLQYVDKVSFSCDSPRRYINDQIGRGEDSYDHIKEIIPHIRKYYDKDKLLIDINTVVTYDPDGLYRELDYMIDAIRNELLNNSINKWKIIRFYPLRGKAKDNKNKFYVPDEKFIEIKKEYETDSEYLKIDVRNFDSLDNNVIVSPCGIIKVSRDGEEIPILDLKPAKRMEEGANRVQ
jgi:MoaA/NifB/PqqE/SkfB family radical SAM enzyme